MTKKIPLSQNKFALVDDEDYDFLMQWKWYFNRGYAVRNTNPTREERKILKRRQVYMHRIVNKTLGGALTDHINGNGVDNQKSNLRSCTHSQNMRNQHKTCGSSKFKGVTWNKQWRKWTSQIQLGTKRINLGKYLSETEAARAYNIAAAENYGEFVKLNEISE